MKYKVISPTFLQTAFFFEQLLFAQDVHINKIGATVGFEGTTKWIEFHHFEDSGNILDYTQYGEDVNGRNDVADQNGIWTETTFVDTVESSQTYSFFSLDNNEPVNNWKTGEPTPGAENIEAVATSIEDNVSEITGKFEIIGNFPNPFNPTTTIQFNLPSAAIVQVDVYNITGQKVMSIKADSFSAVPNRQIFVDAGPISSGTYFYRVSASTSTDLLLSDASFMLFK